MLNCKFKSGAFTGTGAAMNIECGFVPKYVKVVNMNDAGALDPPMLEWIDGMADGTGLKLVGTTVAFSQLATLGISKYLGDAGMAALTGTISTVIGTAGIVGVGTAFLTELKVGDVIKSDYNGENIQILAITSNTVAAINALSENTAATKTFKRINGRAAGFTLGADADVNVAAEAGVWMAIGDST